MCCNVANTGAWFGETLVKLLEMFTKVQPTTLEVDVVLRKQNSELKWCCPGYL